MWKFCHGKLWFLPNYDSLCHGGNVLVCSGHLSTVSVGKCVSAAWLVLWLWVCRCFRYHCLWQGSLLSFITENWNHPGSSWEDWVYSYKSREFQHADARGVYEDLSRSHCVRSQRRLGDFSGEYCWRFWEEGWRCHLAATPTITFTTECIAWLVDLSVTDISASCMCRAMSDDRDSSSHVTYTDDWNSWQLTLKSCCFCVSAVEGRAWVSEQFLHGTSAQYRLCSAILLKLYKS